jgi:hypothetical protein
MGIEFKEDREIDILGNLENIFKCTEFGEVCI